GLFHGIQTALFAQQMAARAQLEQMRRALPPGMVSQDDEEQGRGRARTGGPYL
ncbi:proteasome activator, partial [Streptomyces roseolilacinus]|uniref:proteasome activator n=1 Tax=Streptomyces roseolilacinus TaxID=66904 RepID=UPI0038078770